MYYWRRGKHYGHQSRPAVLLVPLVQPDWWQVTAFCSVWGGGGLLERGGEFAIRFVLKGNFVRKFFRSVTAEIDGRL